MPNVPGWKLFPHWKLAVLDWNGTLLNDFHLWVKWTKYIFERYELPEPDIEECRDEIGTDYMKFYREHGINETKENLNRIREEFLRPLRKTANLQVGALAMLELCRSMGMKIAVVSAEDKNTFDEWIRRLNLGVLVDSFEGGVHDKQEAFKKLFLKYKICPHKSFYVGDTASDILDANAVGMTSVAFTGGYNTLGKLLWAEPKFICRSFESI